MAEVDKNNVLTVKRRPKQAAAVQFTGKNGAEVVAFVKEYYGEPAGFNIRNGGSYISVSDQVGANYRARKGDWVVVEANGGLLVLSPEDFDLLYSIKG